MLYGLMFVIDIQIVIRIATAELRVFIWIFCSIEYSYHGLFVP